MYIILSRYDCLYINRSFSLFPASNPEVTFETHQFKEVAAMKEASEYLSLLLPLLFISLSLFGVIRLAINLYHFGL
jgi:hypothetical protein